MELAEYFPIWNKLTQEDQAALAESVGPMQYKKGDLVHTGGDCMGLMLVMAGQLRAYTVSEDGREITLYRLFEWDICLFSASCIINSIQFDVYIETEKDTETLLIAPDVYKSVMEESAALANFTSEVMASRFSEVMWLMEQIMWKSFDKRLAQFLLQESEIEGTDTLKITHEAIGNHMGNPREVVTRMLRYFQGEGLVKLSRGTVELVDTARLRALS